MCIRVTGLLYQLIRIKEAVVSQGQKNPQEYREHVMNLRSKRAQLQAVNGAVGLVLGLGGYVGQLYSAALATFLMLAIWIVGATLINLLTDPTDKR